MKIISIGQLEPGNAGRIIEARPRYQEMGLRVGCLIRCVNRGIYLVGNSRYVVLGADIKVGICQECDGDRPDSRPSP